MDAKGPSKRGSRSFGGTPRPAARLAAALALGFCAAMPVHADDYDMDNAVAHALPDHVPVPTPFVPPDSAAGGSALGPGFYAQAAVGVRGFSSQASAPYFDPGETQPVGFSRQLQLLGASPLAELALGCQLWGSFGLELGGSVANQEIATATATASWDTYEAYVMPALRFGVPGVHAGHPAYQTFGVRLGSVLLDGVSDGTVGATPGYPQPAPGPTTGSSGETGRTTDLGFVFRIQALTGARFNLGVELAYDYVYFPRINGPSGAIAGPAGAPLRLNASGPSVKLVLGSWLGSPYGARP